MTPRLSQHPYPVARANRPASRRLPLHAQVRRHAELALRLSSALDAAMSAQYEPGAYDGAGRQAIGHADPTGETAASQARLQLRASVVTGERTLETTARALERCLTDLEDALDTHQGETGDDPADPQPAAA